MQLINQKVRFNGNDIKFTIPLTSKNTLDGHRESIEGFILQQRGFSINDIEDIEKVPFYTSADYLISFLFYSGSADIQYAPNFRYATFTQEEADRRVNSFIGSFFILQIYDTPVSETQTLLHTGYYNGFNFIDDSDDSILSRFDVTQDNQREFNYYYFSNSFLNSSTANTVTVYGRFYFYNAKTGLLQLFYNNNDELYNLDSESDIYFEITLDKQNRTYTHNTSTLVSTEIINPEYNERINASVASFENKQPVFPSGNSFTSGRTYQVI